jgi:hypothetical protein
MFMGSCIFFVDLRGAPFSGTCTEAPPHPPWDRGRVDEPESSKTMRSSAPRAAAQSRATPPPLESQ